MNRYYLIIPIVLMAVFFYFERGASKDADIRTQELVEAKKKDEAKKADERRILEEKTRLDSEKRAEQRALEDKAKDEKNKADFAAKIQKLKDEAKKFTDETELNNRKIVLMEKELAEKRAQRENENRVVLDIAKKVEITKKSRRAAELEVQRFTEMLATRAGESSMTAMPTVAISADAAKK
jgi:hypothetical protein